MYTNSPVRGLSDLKNLPQWVCYDSSKKPINPHTGYGADCNDPASWGTYDQARFAWKRNGYPGVGFEFVKEQGITGVDLDKCVVDGVISEFAQRVIKLLDSYTEFSPSGMGIHIWVHGNIPENLKASGDGIEMYDHIRYFTVTGNRVPDTTEDIEDRQEELIKLYQEITEHRNQAQKQKGRSQSKVLNFPGLDTPYGLAALDIECQDMASAPNGARNESLNRAAYSLGQLVAGSELSRTTVERELYAAAEKAGLGHREIENTMRSGIESGMKSPRNAPPKPQNNTFSTNGHQGPSLERSPDRDLCDFTPDDAGNGEAMHQLFGRVFAYNEAIGWMHYTGTHWEPDEGQANLTRSAIETLRARRHAAVEASAENIVKATISDTKRINGAITCFRAHAVVSVDIFDAQEHLLNCKNGVVNLKTGELTPHSNEQRFTYCVPVEYKESDPLEWIDYLTGVVGGGAEMIDYLQLALGYSLTGSTREECLFYVYGPSRSGKGTVSEIFLRLLPRPLSTMVDFNSFTAKREGDVSNFDLAELKPSRVVFASESQRNQSLNPAKIKQLTGGDLVRASFKHKQFFTYRPQFKVWMLSNWPVNGDPEDDALWGRVRVIPFPNSFLGKEDKSKKERLKSDEVLTSILYWGVQGAIKWYALDSSGLQTPTYVSDVTKSQREAQDFVQQWLSECCVDDNEAWTPNEVIIASYTQWCEGNNVTPKKAKALAQSLQMKGFKTGVAKWVSGKTQKGVNGLKIPVTVWTANENLTDQSALPILRQNPANNQFSIRDDEFPVSSVRSVSKEQSVRNEDQVVFTELESEIEPDRPNPENRPCYHCGVRNWQWDGLIENYICGSCNHG